MARKDCLYLPLGIYRLHVPPPLQFIAEAKAFLYCFFFVRMENEFSFEREEQQDPPLPRNSWFLPFFSSPQFPFTSLSGGAENSFLFSFFRDWQSLLFPQRRRSDDMFLYNSSSRLPPSGSVTIDLQDPTFSFLREIFPFPPFRTSLCPFRRIRVREVRPPPDTPGVPLSLQNLFFFLPLQGRRYPFW